MELRTFKRTLIRARKAKPLGAWQSCFCHWPSDPEENLRRFPEKDGLFVNICSQVQDLFWIASTLIFFLISWNSSDICLTVQRIFDDLSIGCFEKRRQLLLLNIRSLFCLIVLFHSNFILLITHCWYQSKMVPINLEPKKISALVLYFHALKQRFRGVSTCTRGKKLMSCNDFSVPNILQ